MVRVRMCTGSLGEFCCCVINGWPSDADERPRSAEAAIGPKSAQEGAAARLVSRPRPTLRPRRGGAPARAAKVGRGPPVFEKMGQMVRMNSHCLLICFIQFPETVLTCIR
jgi:hypothetical protein